MSKLKKKFLAKKINLANKKKHVETMFLTDKHKNYPFYFKPTNPFDLVERNPQKTSPLRKVLSLRCVESGYLTANPLKAIIRLYKWFIKFFKLETHLNYRLYVFPDFVLTSKPKEVRMGKGKGAPSKKVAIVRRGQIIFSLFCRDKFKVENLLLLLLKKMIYKLPFKTVITRHNW